MVHPNQEPAVIAGQGTIGLEVLEQVRNPAQGSAPCRQGLGKKGQLRCQQHSYFLSAQVPEVNAVVVPVGGGGMIAGIAVAIKVGNNFARKQWLHLPLGRARVPSQAAAFLFRNREIGAWGLHGLLAPWHLQQQ